MGGVHTGGHQRQWQKRRQRHHHGMGWIPILRQQWQQQWHHPNTYIYADTPFLPLPLTPQVPSVNTSDGTLFCRCRCRHSM